MINFIVCDDEKEFRKKVVNSINSLLIKSNINYNIKEFESYTKSFENVINLENSSNIYILDIELKGSTSGIDIARKIRKTDWNSIIILVTSHSELGYEALKAQIMLLGFISKFDDCDKNLVSVIKKAVLKIDNKKILLFETGGISHRLYLDDILYITKDTVDRKCIIKTTYNEFAVNKTMNQMIEELDNRFYLTHRSCLVNVDKIRTVDWRENRIHFNNGESTYLLSRDKKKGLKEYVKNN